MLDRQQQVQRVGRRGLEVEAGVEGAGFRVQSVHQDRTYADQVGCGHAAGDRVAQQMAAQALALFLAVNRQP